MNIQDEKDKAKIKGFSDQPLKQPKKKNYWHFLAANTLIGQSSNGGMSPSGKTWHHHCTKGLMQLLNREVHKAFKHIGGKHYWGSESE